MAEEKKTEEVKEEVASAEPTTGTPVAPPPTPAKKGGNNTIIIIVVVILVLILGGWAMSAYLASKIVGVGVNSALNNAGIKVDTKNNSGTIKTKEGDLSFGEDLKLPSDWPADAPTHNKGKITGTTSSVKNGHFLTQEISDSQANVTKYFKDEYAKKGWTLEAEVVEGMLSFKKGTSTAVMVIGESDGKTQATITVTENQNTE